MEEPDPEPSKKLSFEKAYKTIVSSPEIEQLFISHLESCYSLENLQFVQETDEFEQVSTLLHKPQHKLDFTH
jgi:hypothetical protein